MKASEIAPITDLRSIISTLDVIVSRISAADNSLSSALNLITNVGLVNRKAQDKASESDEGAFPVIQSAEGRLRQLLDLADDLHTSLTYLHEAIDEPKTESEDHRGEKATYRKGSEVR
jgi:hypothetical protein